ncbi:DUF2314 domain-containing protein [Mameliella alba]|nr:DUF2314 domain-containing protein [Mameliella alba]MBY6170674.1 DUF2314 domain-containing protein [Mameliella alba]MBY6175692.1 DUF2314 domain-containing protein [Mameliella alba]
MLIRRITALSCALCAVALMAAGQPLVDPDADTLEEARQQALSRIYDHPGPVHIIPEDALPPGILPTLHVRSSDPALNRAFAEARKSLPAALAATEKRNGWFSPSLALYVAVFVNAPDKPIEFVWVDNIRREGKGYRGTLASHPRLMPGKRLRTRIQFLNPQIADWAVQAEDGRYYGYFTTRARLPGIEEPLASELRALLVGSPVPALWR